MRDILTEVLVTLIGALILAFQRWKAQRDFENTRGQNQALSELKEGAGIVSAAPAQPSRTRRGTGLLPRAPTPLPFFPAAVALEAQAKLDAASVPEAIRPERSVPHIQPKE